MPVFGRPLRTIRAIECIAAQTATPWEAFILGDGCPYFNLTLRQSWFKNMIGEQAIKGNRIITGNTNNNLGGWGYYQTNIAIDRAKGKYFVFMANDDFIWPHHFEYYLSQIEGTKWDFVWFDGSLRKRERLPYKLKRGHIGDNALIIRTDFLKRMPRRGPHYGHDWTLIENMIRAGARYRKSCSDLATYEIMSSPKDRQDPDGID